VSVKPMPLREIAALGFERLKVSDVLPFKATLATPKALEIAGGSFVGEGGLPDEDDPPPQAVENKLIAIMINNDDERAFVQNAGAFRSFFLWSVTVRQFIVLHLGFNVHLVI